MGEVRCEPALGFPGVQLVPDVECQEQRSEDSVSQSCTPIASRYTLQLGLSGTPLALDPRLTRDD